MTIAKKARQKPRHLLSKTICENCGRPPVQCLEAGECAKLDGLPPARKPYMTTLDYEIWVERMVNAR
jgi:predicted amidophosphoribosyltransferase